MQKNHFFIVKFPNRESYRKEIHIFYNDTLKRKSAVNFNT